MGFHMPGSRHSAESIAARPPPGDPVRALRGAWCTMSASRMAEFVFNPRRAPRAPVRCRAEITGTDGSRWTSETEDVGPRGCQIVAPHRRPQGEPLLLLISTEGLSRTLRVGGKVAWISAAEPWRLGVAFAEQDAAVAVDWYEALLAKNPALAAYRGVPDRISVDATVFLGPPPRLVMDFTRDEIQILRCIGSGVSVGELRGRLRDIWDRAQHALFSLIVRRHLVLARGASVLPGTWKQILMDLEATLAVEELERSAQGPTRSFAAPAAPPFARTPLPGSWTPPSLTRTPPPPSRARTPEPPAAYAPVHPAAPELHVPHSPQATPRHDARAQHDFQGAGVGWRSQPRPRSREADELFRRASLDAEAGKVDGALGLLRRALQLAPGDPEIAELLGRLAFRDRSPPEK